MYICDLTHHTLTWLRPHEFNASNVTTKMQEKWRIISAWSYLIACKENLHGRD